VRTAESSAQYAAAQALLGHPMSTIPDLTNYLSSYFAGEIVMNHNLWVHRKSTSQYMSGEVPDPTVSTSATQPGTDPAIYGWPSKTTDKAAQFVPFISDACFSGYGTTGDVKTDHINITGANNSASLIAAKKTSGHVQGNSVSSISVNAAYADGHVGSHKKTSIVGVYLNSGQQAGWFY
jgi:prepilin-type processing-associated H-X9-DG protein